LDNAKYENVSPSRELAATLGIEVTATSALIIALEPKSDRGYGELVKSSACTPKYYPEFSQFKATISFIESAHVKHKTESIPCSLCVFKF